MKKLLLLIIFLSLTACSSTVRIGSVNSMNTTIEDTNNRAGKTVIRINGKGKPDEIYYIPFYSHKW